MSEQGYIGFGQVRHERCRPKLHKFNYPGYFVYLPMRQMVKTINPYLPFNKRSGLSFYDEDHGEPTAKKDQSSLAWFEKVLEENEIPGVDGEIWLQCFPRVWGYAFKPVSFWYGYSKSRELKIVLVEVNNTFGQRHCYLIESPKFGHEYCAEKVFHVSPFIQTKGEYRFRFMLSRNDKQTSLQGLKTVVRIDYYDDQGLLLKTSMSGTLEPISKASKRKALLRYPLMTVGVILKIHLQALFLWVKGAKYHPLPTLPEDFITFSKTGH
ncbi:MAG: DUF1365 domain-containing protein [Betaproteobacteria bacterium]